MTFYVGGNFTAYNGADSSRTIRLNSDGSIDTGFDVGTGFNSAVYSIAVATDGSGDIFAGGQFTTYRGNARDYITRIKSNGSNDANFGIGTGFNSTLHSIATATDGSGDIYVGGGFSTHGGTNVGSLTRLDSVGQLR